MARLCFIAPLAVLLLGLVGLTALALAANPKTLDLSVHQGRVLQSSNNKPNSPSPSPPPLSANKAAPTQKALDAFAAIDPDPEWKKNDKSTDSFWRTNGMSGGGAKGPPAPANLGPCPAPSIFVSKTGSIKSINAAVKQALASGKRRVTIKIASGVYREKVRVGKSAATSICMLGSGSMSTVIAWNDNAGKTGTFGSCSLCVMNDNFVLRDIQVKNDARWNRADKGSTNTRMAVALLASCTGCQFYSSRFIAVQDTLYAHRGVQYYRGCYIEGLVDFIFGNAKAVFEASTIYVKGGETIPGFVTAHNRQTRTENTGFVFTGCTFAGAGKAYLGRPWGPAAKVIITNSYLGSAIETNPAAWARWGNRNDDNTVSFAQYGCSGPGTQKWPGYTKKLTAQSAAAYKKQVYIGSGWTQ